jgi:hypothetical protein
LAAIDPGGADHNHVKALPIQSSTKSAPVSKAGRQPIVVTVATLVEGRPSRPPPGRIGSKRIPSQNFFEYGLQVPPGFVTQPKTPAASDALMTYGSSCKVSNMILAPQLAL